MASEARQDDDPWLNANQVGDYFSGKSSGRLSRFTIDRWVARGILAPPKRFGRYKRWRRSWVRAAEAKLEHGLSA